MRIKRFFFLLMSLCFAARLSAQSSILFKGKVSEEEVLLKRVKVRLYLPGMKLLRSVKTAKTGAFELSIPLAEPAVYLVVISKRGYVSKRCVISTEDIPKKERDTEFAPLTADVTLFRPVKGVDYSELEQPMTTYYYDPQKDKFEYDKKQLERMLGVLEKLKRK